MSPTGFSRFAEPPNASIDAVQKRQSSAVEALNSEMFGRGRVTHQHTAMFGKNIKIPFRIPSRLG